MLRSSSVVLLVIVRISDIEKAIDIYSRRGAENAGGSWINLSRLYRFILIPLRSLRLCEKNDVKAPT